jgi:hypothetical protein
MDGLMYRWMDIEIDNEIDNVIYSVIYNDKDGGRERWMDG